MARKKTNPPADHGFHRQSRFSTCLLGFLAILASGCQWAANGQNAQGTRLYEQGQYTEALQQFQKVIASNPDNPDGYYNQCLDHNPNHTECHRALAVLLVETGRPDRAFALLKNWASRNPMLAEPRVELARLYQEHNEPQTALKYLEDAVQQDGNNARAWLALAQLREESGDLLQALQNYQRAQALSNTPLVTERVAALSRQLNANRDAALSRGGTQIAQPFGGTTRY